MVVTKATNFKQWYPHDVSFYLLTYKAYCFWIFMYYKTGGLVTTTADLSTIQIPAYDVYVTVNDGHTSVGQKSLSIHVFSKYNVCNMKRKFV